jgi:hypothetical protein
LRDGQDTGVGVDGDIYAGRNKYLAVEKGQDLESVLTRLCGLRQKHQTIFVVLVVAYDLDQFNRRQFERDAVALPRDTPTGKVACVRASIKYKKARL